MNITIGTIALTSKNAPKVSMKYEYYKTETNITIGGKKTITVNGVVSVSDDGSLTGSNVMKQLKTIRDAGKTSKCVVVSIPDFYSGKARIENITIEQGADPTWVNQGAFSINLEAPLDVIPPNPYGIVAQDYVKSLSFSEKIDVGEDSHGFVYTSDNQLSKAFVRFSSKVNVEVDPLCQSINIKTLLEKIIRKFIKNSPSHSLLIKYRTWRVFIADRSYTVSNANAELNTSSILLSPSSRGQSAFVDLNFEHRKTYDKDEETKVASGNIRGLVNIPWGDIISLGSSFGSSKLASAESALSYIIKGYSDIAEWDGIEYALTRYNCPPSKGSNDPCAIEGEGAQNKDCLKPSSSSVARNRTDGSIDFSFEWVNTDCGRNSSSSTTVEYQVDDIKSQPTTAEFTIPTVGILLQNINCQTARRITFTSNLNFPDNSGNCLEATPEECSQKAKLEEFIAKYFRDRRLTASDYLLIDHTFTKTNRVNTLKKGFVSLCLTQIT